MIDLFEGHSFFNLYTVFSVSTKIDTRDNTNRYC